ncbi:MAG: hypothetical protein K1X68_00320 [Saprospiraceae bacterium]|nr:hypothetical protein [Saprospiraceae bacterium]HMW38618.1 hypothetical protein [Saprospiraceae bacterium]HMX88516.1 hypothetical protein [Saprospiraceae bacterium]HMZ40534.1 hypothetical protein [Saprospiraceae bacterium]HNA64001.1 hypothetical protein [Saprospiraceae bacterium]
MSIRNTLYTSFLLLIATCVNAQLNAGLVFGADLYQQYTNPVSGTLTNGRSSGSVGSLILGAEVMAGARNFSIGVQASANLAPLALDINEYKGLGAVAFPVMAKLNFGALSGFSSKFTGAYLGGGLQWSRTELFGLNSKHKNVGRDLYSCPFGELGLGGGFGGLTGVFYVRLGFGPDKRRVLNIGITTRIDFKKNKQLFSPAKNPLKS